MCLTKNKPGTFKMPVLAQYRKYLTLDNLKKVIIDPQYVSFACWGILVFEVFLNIFIIQNVNYTEIDWIAYMQEVQGFLNGTWDYQHLKGDTGPLVYPAGFVYIYSLLYYITSNGTNILLAQYIFLCIYIAQLYFTFEIFKKTAKIPPYALILVTLSSYRIHSIYVLRLFNDPIAVLLFYISLNALIADKWIVCSIFYSLAVSVKMNTLLYAPALLLAYLTNLTYMKTFINLSICALIQFLLALPFLYENAISYLMGSFDLGRVFEHKWTVNFRFLSRDIFENKIFHIGLLVCHILILLIFLPFIKKYFKSYSTLRSFINDLKVGKPTKTKTKSKVPVKTQSPSNESLSKDQERFINNYEQSLKQGNTKQRKAPKQQQVNKESEKRATDKVQINFSKITQLLVLPFFVTNLIGIAFARSLHYQFYCWYYHSLVYLVHCTPFKKPVLFLILGSIEYCWNVYPSTEISSSLLHVCHAVLIYGLYKTMKQ